MLTAVSFLSALYLFLDQLCVDIAMLEPLSMRGGEAGELPDGEPVTHQPHISTT